MALQRFSATQIVATDIDTAWRFFSDPRNLARMTPPWLGLVPTSKVPEEMYPGLIVTYRVRPAFGVRVEWVTEITHVMEGRLFVDEQRSGPYRFWHHQHHFRAVDGGVEVKDIVHYRLPLATIADLVAGNLVRRQLSRIFAYRRRMLANGELFR